MKLAPRLMPLAARRRSDSGSAFIITLLVLVVLTFLGLTLVLVTQTELQIGGNEKAASRVLYAADSGISVAVTRRDHGGVDPYTFSVEDTSGVVGLRNEIELSAFAPTLESPCRLCEFAQSQQDQKQFRVINHYVTSTARRKRMIDTPDAFAERTLGVMVEMQPLEHTTTTEYEGRQDGTSGGLKEIK